MTTLQSLFDEHVGASLLRQEQLAALVGDAAWGVNLSDQTLTFHTLPPRRMAIQVLGSESESSRTWMWGWANAASELPPLSLRLVDKLRAFASEESISELTTPVIPLREWDGHRLSLVAAGLASAAGYFRCPYDGGALFVVIPEAGLPSPEVTPVLRLTRALPEVISSFRVMDHRLALEGLATFLGLSTRAGPDAPGSAPGITGPGSPPASTIVVSGPDGTATACFDAQHRLVELKGSLARPGSA